MNGIEQLDNPAWYALTTLHSRLALMAGDVARYRPEVSVFAAISAPQGLTLLQNVVAQGEIVALASRPDQGPQLTDDWTELQHIDLWQMVCAEPDINGINQIGRELTEADADAMYSLAKLTDPGPFERQTRLMGRYVGVDEPADSRTLHAMAGERFRVPGWVEVSGVCTHPDARGQGYAASLVANIIRQVHAAGSKTFLHVRLGSPSAASAIRVYERLGFHHHQKMQVVVLQRRG